MIRAVWAVDVSGRCVIFSQFDVGLAFWYWISDLYIPKNVFDCEMVVCLPLSESCPHCFKGYEMWQFPICLELRQLMLRSL
jgi:hypothetical protein